MNQRRPVAIKITLGQARTLEVLLNTRIMVGGDLIDLSRYRALREAVSRGIAMSLDGAK